MNSVISHAAFWSYYTTWVCEEISEQQAKICGRQLKISQSIKAGSTFYVTCDLFSKQSAVKLNPDNIFGFDLKHRRPSLSWANIPTHSHH